MEEKKVAIAIGAHPDDIEFGMAGTLFLLNMAGYETHYLTIANGNCGSLELSAKEIAEIRNKESKNAAIILGAKFHEPLCDDFNIFINPELQCKLCDIIREVQPDIVLTQSPEDYMLDHENTAELTASAVFYRAMRNSFPDSKVAPTLKSVRIYHAQPHGNRDKFNKFIYPDMLIGVDIVMDVKEAALKAHKSQDDFLRRQQGIDAYVTMKTLNKETARDSDYKYAEGWRLRNWRGYCNADFNPLAELQK